MNLILGDCLEKLKDLPDNSVDSIVTDPPYGLSFMNKKWDYDVPSTEIWIECLRVLKPGGHLLSFSGSRTYHRMAVRIEDAGFEIRDQIMWIYGSSFPKSHNVGKAVDKLQGNEREVVGTSDKKSFECWADFTEKKFKRKDNNITKGQSEWEGWGTTLKPAHEPIVVARKPLSEKSVALNVLKWGTGGINIDASRFGTEQIKSNGYYNQDNETTIPFGISKKDKKQFEGGTHTGRFPANIILDEEAGQILDEQSGINSSRFFYCPKTSKKDRNDNNNHPTVKPTSLMEYLIKLVTPVNGIVLDPFMGSGSTGKAAVKNGYDFIGIEREEEYITIAKARIILQDMEQKIPD